MQDGMCDLCQSIAPDLISNLVFPTLVQDITNKADKWGNDGKNGRIDPFTEIYDVSFGGIHWRLGLVLNFPFQLVFAMTARIATCDDLAKNEADLKKAGELFMTLQASATPTSLLLPWFPSPAGKTGKRATTELYTMLRGYVESRRHAPEFQNDAFDILIADGETTRDIVGVGPATNIAWVFPKSDPTLLVRHDGAFRWCH